MKVPAATPVPSQRRQQKVSSRSVVSKLGHPRPRHRHHRPLHDPKQSDLERMSSSASSPGYGPLSKQPYLKQSDTSHPVHPNLVDQMMGGKGEECVKVLP